MTHDQDAAVAAATVADDARSALLADLQGRVAGCFPRRETRQCCGQMASGLLMELNDHNCWTIAEAAGHRGPHRLQHLLSGIKKFVRTARRYRTITIQGGPHTITAADPLPDDLRAALTKIHNASPSAH